MHHATANTCVVSDSMNTNLQESSVLFSNATPRSGRVRLPRYEDFSPLERFVLYVVSVTALVSGTLALYRYNDGHLTELSRTGGVHHEAMVGTPHFVNPLIASSDIDRDLVHLVYAGLLTRSETGELIPELAERLPDISDDGLTYTFHLREGLTFHDGSPVTAADVVFTMRLAANAAIKSPLFADWDGVTVTAPDPHTVVCTLPKPYAPFLNNTTLGILPEHLWGNLSVDEFPQSEHNMMPIGAGPYRIVNVTRDPSGIPVRYELEAFHAFVLDAPHISTLVFELYKNDTQALNAFARGDVQAVTATSSDSVRMLQNLPDARPFDIHRAPLLRTFAIFLNHNKQSLFMRDKVRQALDTVIPREAIVTDVLHGYGTAITNPVPLVVPDSSTTGALVNTPTSATASSSFDDSAERMMIARSILEQDGWERDETSGVYVRGTGDKKQELAFELTTVRMPELMTMAERIAAVWRDLGARVDVKTYEVTDLTQSIIRPRKYDALLFGVVLGHEVDMYAFWHSSQLNDPGLNVAQYADIDTDKLLEQERTELDPRARAELATSIARKIEGQHAAFFLYMPDYLYLTRGTLHQVTLHPLADTAERFDTIQTWFMESDRVWPFVKHVLE